MERARLSCHHGDIEDENTLAGALRVAQAYPEIDVYEIDFVSEGRRVVSSHDFNAEAIARGSELEQWLEAFVVERRRTLWLDVKQNMDVFFAWQYGPFDVALLFDKLGKARERWGRDVMEPRVWIGCQDLALREEVVARCRAEDWRFIMDLPSDSAYILQRASCGLCAPQVNSFVGRQILRTEYDDYELLSIDRAFFKGPKEIKRFIKALRLRPGVTVVLNSFPRSQEPIQVEDVNIVMQYDYSTRT